ncbi:hypothetical protein LXL04_004299 [Taraxacum kok-saghyz]
MSQEDENCEHLDDGSCGHFHSGDRDPCACESASVSGRPHSSKFGEVYEDKNENCFGSESANCAGINPVDERYFISGSLDSKVRIWSIPDHHVVDWNDMKEMVTAASYTPDGQAAIVGSYKGSCCLYDTTVNDYKDQNCN